MSVLKFDSEYIRKYKSRFTNVHSVRFNSENVEIQSIFEADKFPDKVNLVSDVFQSDDNSQWCMPLISRARRTIANDETLDKDHHSTELLGVHSFTFASTKLLLGLENAAIIENRCFCIQTIGSSGALSLGARFLNKILGYTTYYFSHPGRKELHLLFENNGLTDFRVFQYFNELKNKVDMDATLHDLNNAPPNSVIFLQMVGHNPTGCDFTHEQWAAVADVMAARKLFPFFDSTYQGFASGDLDLDAYPLRYFVNRGFELFCAHSYSKSFGLYDQSVGTLLVILNTPKRSIQIRSQFKQLVSCMYAYPAYYGARIVSYILNNPQFYEEWKACVKEMSVKIKERRNMLRQALERMQTPGMWVQITHQIGIFSYTGLNPEQVKAMMDKYHIYLLSSGRMCLCGITPGNVEYVAKAIRDVITLSKCKEST